MFARPIVTLFSALVISLLVAAPALADCEFLGVVLSVDEDELVLVIDEEHQTFAANSDTHVTLDGREAALENIMPGHVAKVCAKPNGAELVATRIDAFSVK